MIEESEKLKSTAEDKASHLADRLVPYTLGGTALTYLLTRNAVKALSVLMVDFSCALKLSMPIAVLSAMREGNKYNISVKGGRFLEAVAKADTVVFDKTGTLTYAKPTVAQIVTFAGKEENEMLRLAACLEEHYPHSLASAVVDEAKNRGLNHEEYHSKVEYVVAHGISSTVEGRNVLIGSYHFIFEDEGCTIPAGEQAKFDGLDPQYSHLYLAASGVLAGVICIADPLRPEAAQVLRQLQKLGITQTVMMTGDSDRTARAIAAQVGVDRCFAEVLPEDKAAFVRDAGAEGHTVVMIGDGINDAPVLTRADIGIAIGAGTDIAIDAADVVLMKSQLSDVPAAVRLSRATLRNIHENLFWAFFYNAIGIPLAAGIWIPLFGWKLNPMFGAAAMSLSSFCVVTNALRLNLFKMYDASKDRKRKMKKVETAENTVSDNVLADKNESENKEETKMTKTMKIEGMMCGHCEARVKKTLEAIEGVEGAEVSHENGTAIVTLNAEVADDVLKQAVEVQDYAVISVE